MASRRTTSGGRPAPGDQRRHEAARRLPYPFQEWEPVASAPSRSEALDEVVWDAARQPPGTLWRIDRAGKPVDLLVNSPAHEAFAAPSPAEWKMPFMGMRPSRGAPKPAEWIAAWDGPDAWSRWMLEQCARVDRVLITRAACAVVAPVADRFLRRAPVFADALRAAEAWASGAASADQLTTAVRAAVSATPHPTYERRTPFSQAAHAVAAAAGCGILSDPHSAAGSAQLHATSAEMLRIRRSGDDVYARLMREQAPIVREHIRLDTVLLAAVT